MQRYGIAAKKGFGQNFLINAHALHEIVEASSAGRMPQDCTMLEIGPGLGTLTQALAHEGFAQVIAIEKDESLLPVLHEVLGEYENVAVIHGDALTLDFGNLLASLPAKRAVRLAANLPYYITTPLLMRLLELQIPFERMVVMVQKEVANRLVARPGTKDYGALSVAVQYYSQPTIVVTVSAGSFMPRPQVDSAVVALDLNKAGLFAHEKEAEALFFRIVRAAFAKRRKTLVNALAGDFTHLDKQKISSWLVQSDIDGMRRGETLSIAEFAELTRVYQQLA